MLHDAGHLHPVGFSENSELVLVDTRHPGVEPIPDFDNEAEREGAMRAIRWLLAPVGKKGIVTKVMACRILLGWEDQSMERVAKEIGVSRAALSKQAVALSAALGLPPLRSSTVREAYSNAQRQVWKSGRRKKRCALTGKLRALPSERRSSARCGNGAAK